MANEFVVKNGIKIPTETASTVPYLDANKKLVSSDVTPTQLSYLDATSSIQTQLNIKAATSGKLSQFAATTSAELAGVISDETGSGALVFGTSPTLTTPNIGAATATSVNGTSIPTSKTLVVTTDKLSTLAATTSAELAGVISDETGSGALVFGTSPTLTTPTTDIITLDGQASTPSNPSAGNYKIYVKDATQKLTVLDSTGAETTVGTGSGGGSTPNYIASPDGTAIGYWVTYDDGASSSPVDGTGGTPGVTFAVSTSSAMRSTSNFLFTHDAADRQGEGFSYLMAIDPSDRGKVLRLSFDYLVASGTYADDGIAVWFYDATNAALIQPAPYLIKNSGLIEKFNCEVQVPSSCASLRVIFHVTTTTATAYTIRFDDFIFGPQAKLYGSPITDWNTSWTPTGTLSTNVTYYGKWRRVGDSMQIEGMISFSGANTQGVANITLPNSANLDTTKFSPVATGRAVFGSARIYDSSTDQSYDAVVTYDTATSIRFSRGDTTAGSATDTSSNRPITFASGDIISFNAIVPILGWSSSLVMSNDASTRVIGARFNNSSTSISGTPAKVVWTNTNKDDIAGYSSGTYTVKVPGWYDIYASLYIIATPSVDQVSVIYIYRNGAAIKDFVHRYKVASATTTSISVSDSYYFNAGDTVEIYAESNATSPSISSSTTKNIFSISRRAGPAQIAASDSIIANGYRTSSSITATAGVSTEIVFNSIRHDSTGSLSTSTGRFTAPSPGRYRVTYSLIISMGATAAADLTVSIKKNGTGELLGYFYTDTLTNSKTYTVQNSETIQLLAGEYVSIWALPTSQNVTVSHSGTNNATSKINIERIGNY